MISDFRRIFRPTPEEQKEDFERYKKIHDELAKKKGCSTCKYCVRVCCYPSFVTGEECKCTAGLKCDTVLFSVSNCPKWEENKNKLLIGGDNVNNHENTNINR